MLLISVNKLKDSEHFRDNIRWDVTPRIFLNPKTSTGETVDVTHGYMLYIDLVNGKPEMVIMQLKDIMSKTVGYVSDIPEDMLKEAMNCVATECVSGMYPLGEKLENWLKKEFGLN